MALIYHLTTHTRWELYMKTGTIKPETFDEEGFIHLSTEEQVAASANKHFKDETEVLLLVVPEKRVRQGLKYEPSRGGALFPHVYNPIPVQHVETLHFLERNKEGEFEWPPK